MKEREFSKIRARYDMATHFSQMPTPTLDITPVQRYESMKDAINPNRKKSRIHISPAAVAGALAGVLLIKNRYEKNKEIRDLPVSPPSIKSQVEKKERAKTPQFSGNFYKDTGNLVKNLGVVFTPVGVSFTLKDKKTVVNMENIGMSEMTNEMQSMWKNQNQDYFKNLMMLKIYSDAKIAEQVFASKMIQNNKSVMGKKASEYYLEFNSEPQIYHEILIFSDKIENNEDMECYAGHLIQKTASIFSEDDFYIDFELPRPFTDDLFKVGSVGFMSAGVQKKLFNVPYLKKNLSIAFMPDRVIYLVNNMVAGTLPVLKMNEEGYAKFKQNDKKYFKTFFIDEAKKGIASFNSSFEKTSEEDTTEEEINIFIEESIHPVIYSEFLKKSYGEEWYDMDSYALIKSIENDYLPEGEPINETVLNKILAVKSCLESSFILENYHAFEKVIRCFSNKPIDFFRRENQDIDISDMAFGLDVLQKLNKVDIYSSFAIEVVQYIANVIANEEIYLFFSKFLEPKSQNRKKDYIAFVSLLNELIQNRLNDKFRLDVDTKREEEIVKNYVYSMCLISEDALSKVRNNAISINNISKYAIDQYKLSPEFSSIINLQVKINLAVDQFMHEKNSILSKQRMLLEL